MRSTLVLLACLALSTGRAWAGSRGPRRLAEATPDPFSNAVTPFNTKAYQALQGAVNDTLRTIRLDAALRLTGAQFVPLRLSDQEAIVQSLKEEVLPYGPVTMHSYREVYPDPDTPQKFRDRAPCLEFTMTMLAVLNQTAISTNVSWEENSVELFQSLLAPWHLHLISRGIAPLSPPEVIFGDVGPFNFQGNFVLHTLMHVDVTLAVTLAGSSGVLSTPQVDAVLATVHASLVDPLLGTLVEVANFTRDAATSLRQHLVLLEVTAYRCRKDATVASPECEEQLLWAALNQALDSAVAREQLQAAGIESVEVVRISEEPPLAPPLGSTSRAADEWVPWHLDRLDQRQLPLDGKFTANATGTGVHVFILSSGVLGTHEEFGYADRANVSRVEVGWGYKGLVPIEDCPDYDTWYGFGTYAASICCGLKLGVAKNATIHSVRYRDSCATARSKLGELYAAGALPSALDLVLSSALRPAVVWIDSWNPGTRREDLSAVLDRLTLLEKANITVISGAGSVPGILSPCDNAIATHSGVISVAATDFHDQATFLGPSNSSCIDIWAPSGGVGLGMTGASAAGPDNYTRVLPRASGAAALVAGVAAQYLELNPKATAKEVRRALLEQIATPGVVTGGGVAPNKLLFTDFMSGPVENTPTVPGSAGGGSTPSGSSSSSSNNGGGGGGSDGGGGLSSGAVVGIAVASALVAGLVIALAGIAVYRRKRQRTAAADSGLGKAGWEISSNEIEIMRHPDGSKWVLGEGQNATVFKAVKGGIQVVAVKQLRGLEEKNKGAFENEMEMLRFVSRDANIVQFFGACTPRPGAPMMLVLEHMEGGDLRSALGHDTAGALQWYGRGSDIMVDIVKGAHFLHSNGVVHRDIKSKNILLDRFGRAKLADVGLSQLQGSSSSSSGYAGTFSYAAPEALLGQAVTEKSDIFSLGVVLWEIVTHEAPVRGCMRDPEVPRECPQEIADAIRDCMQTDPVLRPSALELHAKICARRPSLDPGMPHQSMHSRPPGGSGEGRGALEGGIGKLAESSHAPAEPYSGDVSSGSSTMSGTTRRMEAAGSGRLQASWSGSGHGPSPEGALLIDPSRIEFCKGPNGQLVELGSGSFGTVYKVLLDGVHPLAAKAVFLGQNPDTEAIFLREAWILWRMRHDNLVALSGVAIDKDHGYMLMELMEGGSLHNALNLRSKSTGERVFSWYSRGRDVAIDVAKGLHYFHSFKVVHLDIKSGNVLLTKRGVAKLADCGLARVLTHTHHTLSSNTSAFPGTFAYLAPELMAGIKCTPAADIYSLGVLLWSIVTGTHPVRGQLFELQVPQECPEEVSDLIYHCTAVDPASRPSVREVLDILQGTTARDRLQPSPQKDESVRRGNFYTPSDLAPTAVAAVGLAPAEEAGLGRTVHGAGAALPLSPFQSDCHAMILQPPSAAAGAEGEGAGQGRAGGPAGAAGAAISPSAFQSGGRVVMSQPPSAAAGAEGEGAGPRVQLGGPTGAAPPPSPFQSDASTVMSQRHSAAGEAGQISTGAPVGASPGDPVYSHPSSVPSAPPWPVGLVERAGEVKKMRVAGPGLPLSPFHSLTTAAQRGVPSNAP